jgi:hypothetical protein
VAVLSDTARALSGLLAALAPAGHAALDGESGGRDRSLAVSGAPGPCRCPGHLVWLPPGPVRDGAAVEAPGGDGPVPVVWATVWAPAAAGVPVTGRPVVLRDCACAASPASTTRQPAR